MTGISVNASGTWKTVTGAYVNVSGTWKLVVGGWENVSGTWKRFLSAAPTVTASPTSASGTGTTGSSTASISGGVGPFTVEWEVVSGDTVYTDFATYSITVDADSGTSLTTTWTASPSGSPPPGLDVTLNSVWRAAVTDTGTGLVAYSNNVNVSARYV